MNRLMRFLSCIAFASLLISGCSDKNSNEACLHAVSVNLDAGNYDAVIGSSCADAMQKGAAYFGKAGFDVTNVINRFSQLGSTSTSSHSVSDLQSYLTALVPNVDQDVLDNLAFAKESYCFSFGGVVSNATCSVADKTAAAANEHYYDANFYISLVDTVTTLALVKSSIETLGGTIGLDCSSGTCVATCDRDTNGVPDNADATSCALLLTSAATTSCNTISGPTGSVIASQQIDNLIIAKADGSGNYGGTYYGVIIAVTGSGVNTSCTTSSGTTDSYNKLLFKNTDAVTKTAMPYIAASTTSDVCRESSSSATNTSRTWPCPIEENGQPVDLVSSINGALNSATDTLSTSLVSSSTGSNDLTQSVQDIQAQACCGCTTTPCNACTTTCSSSSLANYLQTSLTTN